MFRLYEAHLIYRQTPGCDEDDAECVCPDDENPLCESRWKVHVGPRYFEFGEAYNVEMEAFRLSVFGGVEGGTYTYVNLDIAGMNEIYGLQLGGEYKVLKNFRDRLDLSVAGRVGYGVNKFRSGASGIAIQFGNQGDPVAPTGGQNEDTTGTLFAQLDLSAGFDITKNIEISAGYRGIWIENTVSAGTIGPSFDLSNAGAAEPEFNDMLLHLGRIGLQVRF